jgi:hypothetical protein
MYYSIRLLCVVTSTIVDSIAIVLWNIVTTSEKLKTYEAPVNFASAIIAQATCSDEAE